MALLDKLRSEPRKQVTGTTYESKPAEAPPPLSYKEIGSQTSTVIRDSVPELNSRTQQTQTYKKMKRSDASVRSSLRAGKAPVLGAEYFVQPFDESPESLIVAEFVSFNLFNAPSVPWLVNMSNALTAFDYGAAVFEPVYELREWAPKATQPTANRKKFTMLRKLGFRPATTIKSFDYDDNGGPIGVTQNAINAKGTVKEVKIPIEKLIIFSFEAEDNGLEGESILRSAYQHWFYKTTLYKIDAIQKERHGIGIPDVEIQAGASKEDKKLAHEMARNLRTNEFSYIVRPPTLKVGFAKPEGNLVNALESANHHDDMIMKNILVQFLNMGLGSGGGGRATSATAADIYLKAMSYIANSWCETINLYLVPRLVAYNFQTDKFPKLSVKNIGETKDFQMWSAGIRNLFDAGVLTYSHDTEQYVRTVADMPVRTTEVSPDELAITGGKVIQGAGASSGNVGKSPTSGAT
jgi:hypothetical protein